MPEAGLKELLEAGVHFGHQTRRWNPNMRRFIFGELDGIHIIDLLQTEALLENARRFAGELASGGGTVLFVGTKKQARDTVQEWAERCQMPYVNKRWLGGLLTNFNTMSARIARLHELNGWKEEGKLDLLPTKERMGMEAELAKLEFNLGGVRDMDRLPDAVFVTDLKTEEIAVHEAARLRIPIIGLVDTNCDPTPVDYVIPGNDDAIRSCELVIGTIGGAVEEGSERLAGAGGEADRRGNGAAQKRRGRAEETRGRRESPGRSRGGQKSRRRGGGESGSGDRRSRCARPQKPRRPKRSARGSCRRREHLVLASCGRGPPRHPRPSRCGSPRPAAAEQPRPRAEAAPEPSRPRPLQAAPAERSRGVEMSVSAADVKALRDRTGAAMMDGKSALVEADGDVDRAVEMLRVKGQASAAKREGRGTNEGVVASYIHANDKVGAMVEVQCETDFVARNEEFQVFAYQVALHVAATAPQLRLHRGDPAGGARRRTEGLRREGAGRRQARQRRRENRRGPALEVGERSRAARPDPRQRRETRLEDDRGAAPGAGGENRREHPHRPLRLLPRRRIELASRDQSPEPRFGRILLKLSGEALMGELEFGTDGAEVERIARQVAAVRERGVEVAIVVGAGNIYRGLDGAAKGMDRATGDYMGMLATVLNALTLQDALERLGQYTRVMSAIDVKEVAEPYIRRRAMRHLEKGRVVIFAAGTGNPFFTTDTAAALRALEIHAEAILMAKNGVEGVYDSDPATNPDAKFIPAISHREAIERGLKVMDSTALSLCMDNDLPIYVFNMADELNIDRIVSGEKVGTLVSNGPAAERGHRVPS